MSATPTRRRFQNPPARGRADQEGLLGGTIDPVPIASVEFEVAQEPSPLSEWGGEQP